MNSIPLYQNIVIDLKAKIKSGELRIGDKLPTEAELSRKYNVSRITSKRALTELENANLITRVQGKGSFVHSVVPGKPSDKAAKDILLILPFTHNPGLGDYEKGINEYLASSDYTLNIQSNTTVGQRKVLEAALHSSNAGMILYPLTSNSDLDLLYQYHVSGFPVVTMDKHIEGIPFPSVVPDNFDGAYQATRHLIENHHRKIAFVSSSKVDSSTSIRERYFGYLKALFEHHLIDNSVNELTERHLTHISDDRKDFYTRFIQSMQEQEITGVIAENDLIAIEMIQTAKELGLSVPDDFSIAGFDNIQLASFIEPQLTTVSQDFVTMGRLAAKQLIQLIEHPGNPAPGNTIVPVKLMERQSVRRL
ncbi:GntR family transcriptional regulator [Paenibacillus dakarensis]|uniref:GntR family transcriptional regulator n=1 Tax=Paenibacillus dakarensis TaxID=1527293 RepID=UPI0006D5A11A|nr:GntR family transcriptional regulator [Paenibacillus dakarensis]